MQKLFKFNKKHPAKKQGAFSFEQALNSLKAMDKSRRGTLKSYGKSKSAGVKHLKNYG